MAFDHWAEFGGAEIINDARARGYWTTSPWAHTWMLPAQWMGSLQPALAALGDSWNQDPYTYDFISSAPWYDPSQADVSSRFFGVMGLGITGLVDSTRAVALVESVYDGGTLGIPRKAIKQPVVTAWLFAKGRDALEYGFSWLDAVLDSQACGQHGELCGLADFTFLADAPTAPPTPDQFMDGPDDSGEDSGAYEAAYNAWVSEATALERFLHGAGVVAGPTIDAMYESGGIVAYQVEFTLAATNPHIYRQAIDLDIPPALPEVVSDIPYNLATHPSLELSNGSNVVVATNFATNPSAEVNTTGWSATFIDVTGTSSSYQKAGGQATSGTSGTPPYNNAPTANGNFAYCAGLFGNGSTAASGQVKLTVAQTVSGLSSLVAAGGRISVSVWAAALVLAGASGTTLNSIGATAAWYNSSGTLLRTDNIGVTSGASFNGQVFATPSIKPPTGADHVIISVVLNFNWTSSSTVANNTELGFYVDALAVTNP